MDPVMKGNRVAVATSPSKPTTRMTVTGAMQISGAFESLTAPSRMAGGQLELQQARRPDAHRCCRLRTRHQGSRKQPARRGLEGCQARPARCSLSWHGRRPLCSATCCGGHAAVESGAEAVVPAIICIVEDARKPLVSFSDLHAAIKRFLSSDTLSRAWVCTAC